MPRGPVLAAILTGLFLSTAVAAEPTGRILGTVWDAAHKPVSGAQVRLTSHVEAGLLRITSTDEHGLYRFKDLPSGTYEVLVEAEGVSPVLKKGVEVRAPFQNIVDVALARDTSVARLPSAGSTEAVPTPAAAPVTVRGKLSDAAKQPVVDVSVLLVANDGGRLFQASSNEQGSFTIDGVIPGRYRAIIRSPGHVPVDLKSVEVLAGNGLDVTLALVDFPLSLRKGEVSLPPELPRTLQQPGATTPAAAPLPEPPPASSSPPAPAAPPPIEKPRESPSSPPSPPAGPPPPPSKPPR